MVHALAKKIDLPEELIRDTMRNVFKFHGSLEYPIRAEDLAFLEGRTKSEIQALNRLMVGAFRRCRRKNLKLYDGVLEFLEWIQARQITLVAVTNAPLEMAYDNAFAPDFVAGNIFEAAEIIDCELASSRRIRQKNHDPRKN